MTSEELADQLQTISESTQNLLEVLQEMRQADAERLRQLELSARQVEQSMELIVALADKNGVDTEDGR